MSKLSVLEKGKLERIIMEEISERKSGLDDYSARDRDQDLVTESAGMEVKKIVTELDLLTSKHKELEDKLEKLGFEADSNYQGEHKLKALDSHPMMIKLKDQRKAKREALDKLKRDSIVKVYSAEGGMEKILEEFTKAINKI